MSDSPESPRSPRPGELLPGETVFLSRRPSAEALAPSEALIADTPDLPINVQKIVELQSLINSLSSDNTELSALHTELQARNAYLDALLESKTQHISQLKAQLSQTLPGSPAPPTSADCKQCATLRVLIATLRSQIDAFDSRPQRSSTATATPEQASSPIRQQYGPPEFTRLPTMHLKVAAGLPNVRPSDVPKLANPSDFPAFKSIIFSWLSSFLPILTESLLTAELIPVVADLDAMTIPPTPPADPDNPGHSLENQYRTLNLLRMALTLCKEALGHISVSLDATFPAGHAWQRLCLRWDRTTFIAVSEAAAPLIRPVAASSSGVSYMSTIEQARFHLNLMLPGCISEELIVAFAIFNLHRSPSHSQVVTNLLTQYVNRLPSFSALRYHLEVVHSQPKHAPPPSSPLAGNATTTGQPRFAKKRPLTSHHHLPASLSSRLPAAGKPPRGSCNKCGDGIPPHWAWMCALRPLPDQISAAEYFANKYPNHPAPAAHLAADPAPPAGLPGPHVGAAVVAQADTMDRIATLGLSIGSDGSFNADHFENSDLARVLDSLANSASPAASPAAYMALSSHQSDTSEDDAESGESDLEVTGVVLAGLRATTFLPGGDFHEFFADTYLYCRPNPPPQC